MSEISREDEVENLLHDLELCKYERKAYLTLLKHGLQNYKSLSARLIDVLHHDPTHNA